MYFLFNAALTIESRLFVIFLRSKKEPVWFCFRRMKQLICRDIERFVRNYLNTLKDWINVIRSLNGTMILYSQLHPFFSTHSYSPSASVKSELLHANIQHLPEYVIILVLNTDPMDNILEVIVQ